MAREKFKKNSSDKLLTVNQKLQWIRNLLNEGPGSPTMKLRSYAKVRLVHALNGR
jgi:hypothetical protein